MIKTYMTRIFTVALLMMFSMGASADVKIFYGEKGEELKTGETKIKADNGTIAIEQKASDDGSSTTIYLTFSPNNGYTISSDNIEVYAVISPNSSSTRTPEISGDPLKLTEESSKSPEKRYSVKIDSNLGLWIKKAEFVSGSKGNRNITYTYYALHNKDKGYLKQYKGIVGNDATFRHLTHDDNGSSMWVYSSDGYLQQEMYYLNVLNGQTLVLSTTPVTQWSLIDDGDKKRFQMNGSTKILGFDGSKVVLTDNPTYKYAACTLTVTENNSKWEGPKDVSWTVQSPQLVTYLRTYYLRNITVKIDKNDAGTENVQVANGDSRCYFSLTYSTTSDANKGTKWDINETTGVIRNISTDNKQQSVTATYTLTPLNPIVLKDHPATTAAVTIKVNAKALVPDGNKKYLLFNTQDNNYRFPKATSSLSEGDLLPVNGKQSDLTEAVKGEISWDIEVDGDEGYYLFKNVTTGRYFYYDASDYTVSDYGAVKIGSTTPGDDTRYKFRLYSNAGNRDPFGGCTYIIPYDKQFAVWKSDGVLAELYFALYMNTSASTKIASIYKASDNAKWKIYTYEWEYRLWDNWNINGDQNIYSAGTKNYTASTWFSRNIKGTPANGEHCMLPGSKTHTGITYTWELNGLTDYISTSDALASGTSTLTASVNSLPPGTRTGTLKVTANITSPANKSNNKTIPLTLYNLNPTFVDIDELSDITDANGLYKLTSDNTYSSSNKPGVTSFSGTLDGNGHTVSGLTAPLFSTLDGATVRNLTFDNVNITTGTNVGAVCGEATGNTRIYNCGILATNSTLDEKGDITSCSSSVGGSNYVGGLVGLLNGSARVINCFSYANITGGTDVGGIVGHNNYESKMGDIKTMVMNCMFYGDITGVGSKAPVYNGVIISNKDNKGLGNYNYFYDGASYVKNRNIDVYNCALAAEKRFLQRFEFYRHLLNSNRKLAAWYITNNTADANMMFKWVQKPSQIGSTTPYPILKASNDENGDAILYPSVVNLDVANVTDISASLVNGNPTEQDRNKGCKLGTLKVNIKMGSGGAIYGPPTNASITTATKYLAITDKDYDHDNFNYGKVQLPYYNEVGSYNCTGYRVVTGWKIVDFHGGGTAGSFTTGEDATYDNNGNLATTPYNFADRKCTNKDLYGTNGSNRVFAQGAYFNVPEGVTEITIEPYWGKAAYLADAYLNVVYNTGHGTAYNVTDMGQQYKNDNSYTICGENQKVYTSLDNAVANGNNSLFKNVTYTSHTVYDNAVVLVGNYHLVKQKNSMYDSDKPFTIMSIDEDKDNEPDNTFILQFTSRQNTTPIRFDFINMPGLGMAQKSAEATTMPNIGIFKPNGWFEITNTATIRLGQFEYDKSAKKDAPLILLGGVIDQMVSCNDKSTPAHTIYMILGDNVWFNEFQNGIHQDQKNSTKHTPISVVGGEFGEFHLTGTYRADANVVNDNAECYIDGGKFGEITGAGLDGLGSTTAKGNVTWIIDHADIDEFYGGGINYNKPIWGNIYTTISNSHVGIFCGGPKFGDMKDGKTVTTTATNCVFNTFFGAGYGGTSYNRYSPQNKTDAVNYSWNTWVNSNYNHDYNTTYKAVATNYKYEFIPMSGGMGNNVARIMINYAGFSLATTHNITTTLTGCTVNNNFYGGGKLGKVVGNIISTLDGCTVKGSAFGAGFSATMDPVKVMGTGGFQTEPYYLDQAGIYQDGVYPLTDDYKWVHKDEVKSTESAINEGNKELYTTVDLKKSNLGSVNGNVNLTIKGNSVIGTIGNSQTGDVYGGGDESYVTGSGNKITVTLAGNTEVYGNVFGGGNEGLVEGSTEVKILENVPNN